MTSQARSKIARTVAVMSIVVAGSLAFAPNPSWKKGGVRLSTKAADDEAKAATANWNPLSWAVLRLKATEPRFLSPINYEKRKGVYNCAGCGARLFDSAGKYDSGSGWPAFLSPTSGGKVALEGGADFFGRTEVLCGNCNGHLGHVFPDGPKPTQGLYSADGTWVNGTGRRYCVNGCALSFVERAGEVSED